MKTLQCSKLSIILPEIEKFMNKFLHNQKSKGHDIKDRSSININALPYVSKICNPQISLLLNF